MGGGAWPFLVGGVICLVNSDNERDLSLGMVGGLSLLLLEDLLAVRLGGAEDGSPGKRSSVDRLKHGIHRVDDCKVRVNGITDKWVP